MRISTASRAAAAAFVAILVALAAPGTAVADHIDPDWGDGGRVGLPSSLGSNPTIYSISAYTSGPKSGGLLVAGTSNSHLTQFLVRLTPDGSVDGGFSPASLPPGSQPFALPDGGAALLVNGKITRLNADGSLDADYGDDGVFTVPSVPGYSDQHVSTGALSADGTIIVAGDGHPQSDPSGCGQGLCTSVFVARVLADGSGLDPAFGTGGFYQRASQFFTPVSPSVAGVGVSGDGSVGLLMRDTTLAGVGPHIVDVASALYDRLDSTGARAYSKSFPGGIDMNFDEAYKVPGPLAGFGVSSFAYAVEEGAESNEPNFYIQGGTDEPDPVRPIDAFSMPDRRQQAFSGSPDGQLVTLGTYQDQTGETYFGESRVDATGAVLSRRVFSGTDLPGLQLAADDSGAYVAGGGEVVRLTRDQVDTPPPVVTISGPDEGSTVSPGEVRFSLSSSGLSAGIECAIDHPFAPADPATDCTFGFAPASLSNGYHCIYARAYTYDEGYEVFGPLGSRCVNVDRHAVAVRTISLQKPSHVKGLATQGVRAQVSCPEQCTAQLLVTLSSRVARLIGRSAHLVATASVDLSANTPGGLTAKISGSVERKLERKAPHAQVQTLISATQN